MAITQMEPARARYMVPCFDEPEFKAVWKLQIIHPSGTTAISNGMEIGSAVQMLVFSIFILFFNKILFEPSLN